MKTDKKAKNAYKKLKLKTRAIWNIYDWSEDMYDWSGWKKPPTGEFELFKKIADEACWESNFCHARHIFPDGTIWWKIINKNDLTPTNFSHKIPKSRWEKYRLDPDNIEIVSMAYHNYEHTKQILKIDYPN